MSSIGFMLQENLAFLQGMSGRETSWRDTLASRRDLLPAPSTASPALLVSFITLIRGSLHFFLSLCSKEGSSVFGFSVVVQWFPPTSEKCSSQSKNSVCSEEMEEWMGVWLSCTPGRGRGAGQLSIGVGVWVGGASPFLLWEEKCLWKFWVMYEKCRYFNTHTNSVNGGQHVYFQFYLSMYLT